MGKYYLLFPTYLVTVLMPHPPPESSLTSLSASGNYSSIEGYVTDGLMPVPVTQTLQAINTLKMIAGPLADPSNAFNRIKALYAQALQHMARQQFESARSLLDQALLGYQHLGTQQPSAKLMAAQAMVLIQLGWLAFRQESKRLTATVMSVVCPKAITAFSEAEACLNHASVRDVADPALLAARCRLAYYRGLIQFKLKQYGQALSHWRSEQHLLLSQQSSEQESLDQHPDLMLEQAKLNDLLAIYYERRLDYATAETLILKAIAIKQQLGSVDEISVSTHILARLYTNVGRLADAEKHFDMVLDLALSSGDHARMQQVNLALTELACRNATLGNDLSPDQAKTIQKRLSALFKVLQLPLRITHYPITTSIQAEAFTCLAQWLVLNQQYDDATQLLKHTILPFWQEARHKHQALYLGKTWLLLGQLERQQDNHTPCALRALQQASDALQLAYQTDYSVGEALLTTIQALVGVYQQLINTPNEAYPYPNDTKQIAISTIMDGLQLAEQSHLLQHGYLLEEQLLTLAPEQWDKWIQQRLTPRQTNAINAKTYPLSVYSNQALVNASSEGQQKTQSLISLLKVGQAMAAERDIDKLLTIVKEETEHALQAERCTLFLYDANKNELWSRLASGLSLVDNGKTTMPATDALTPPVTEIRFSAHLGLSGYVAQTGETINIPDVYKDPRFNPEVDKKTGYHTHNMLCMPMWNRKHQLMGVFQVLNKQGTMQTTGLAEATLKPFYQPFTLADQMLLEAIAANAGVAIENAMLDADQKVAFDSFIKTLSSTIDARDPITAGHSERVADYSLLISDELHMPPDEQEALKYASLLHDIGKIGIREEVLVKDGRLTAQEYAHIQTHVSYTYDILKNIHFEKHLASVPEIAASHHEKVDGSGYFRGLRGTEIPLSGRIMAISDVFDAITSRRHYRNRMPFAKVLDIIRRDTGTHFDSDCVKAFFNIPIAYLAEVLIREAEVLTLDSSLLSHRKRQGVVPQQLANVKRFGSTLTISELEAMILKPAPTTAEKDLLTMFMGLYNVSV
jgi:HD-GYP domain-containing protein (c-di-GMP phosphodiesterase class II)